MVPVADRPCQHCGYPGTDDTADACPDHTGRRLCGSCCQALALLASAVNALDRAAASLPAEGGAKRAWDLRDRVTELAARVRGETGPC